MLIYCISYIDFENILLVYISKTFLGPSQHKKLSTAWKMMKYGKIRIRFCPYAGKYGLHEDPIWAYFTWWSFLRHELTDLMLIDQHKNRCCGDLTYVTHSFNCFNIFQRNSFMNFSGILLDVSEGLLTVKTA